MIYTITCKETENLRLIVKLILKKLILITFFGTNN